MKALDVSVLVLLLLFLAAGIYFFWLNVNMQSETENYSKFITNSSSNLSNFNSAQFYPNMRFQEKEISYAIEDACNIQKRKEIDEAFYVLSAETLLRFFRGDKNSQISVSCSEPVQENEEELIKGQQKYFIAGEGGPTEAVNLSGKGFLIKKGKVSLYREEKCNESKLAMHEILHVLGFEHNSNEKSIMYPITSCDQTLDRSIIDEISCIYEQPSLPDLGLEEVNANKTSSRLSFFVSVVNYGYKDASNSKLEIFSEEGTIYNYTLDTIRSGTKKTLEVKNLKISKKADTLTFVVSLDSKDELSFGNNEVKLFSTGTSE
jgi:uncharacterized protein (UPF0333 family)